jgi:hypothetical protein
MLLFRLFGWLLLRLAQRALSRLLFQDPPRKARVCSQGAPPAEAGTKLFIIKTQKTHQKFCAEGRCAPLCR